MEALWPKIEASPTIFDEEKIWNIIRMLVWALKKILWEELIVVSNPYINQLEMTGNPWEDGLINLFQTTIYTIGDSQPSNTDTYAQMTMGILWRSELVTLYYSKDEEINPILEKFIESTILSIISRFESIFLRSYDQIIEQGKVDNMNKLLYTDTLTQIANRRAFESMLGKCIAGEREEFGPQLPLGILIIDVDKFKSINDTHGHDAWDHVLRQIAGTLCEESMSHFWLDWDDFTYEVPWFHEKIGIFRLGGDEFACILHCCTEEQVITFAQKITLKIDALVLSDKDEWKELPPITISVGIATAWHGETMSDLMKRADRGVYLSKWKWGNTFSIGENTSSLQYTPEIQERRILR